MTKIKKISIKAVFNQYGLFSYLSLINNYHGSILWGNKYHTIIPQRAKKVVSESPGLVDFAIGLVNSVLNLPDGKAKTFFRRIKITKVL